MSTDDFNVPDDGHPDSMDEVLRLLSAQTDGSLDEAGRQRLAELLTSDPAARQAGRQYAALTAALRRQARREEAGKKQEPGLTLPAPRRSYVAWIQTLAQDFRREPLALAILLLAMISGSVLFWNLSQLAPQPVAQQPAPPAVQVPPAEVQPQIPNPKSQIPNQVVARLTRSANAAWDGAQTPADGASFTAGEKLSLQQGVAEITFDTGATVVLEGPAELEVGGQGSGVRNQESGAGGSEKCVCTQPG